MDQSWVETLLIVAFMLIVSVLIVLWFKFKGWRNEH